MTTPDDVWDKLMDKRLAESRQSVAKVACYLVEYVMDRTGCHTTMQNDPLYVRAMQKMRALAQESTVDLAVLPEDQQGMRAEPCEYCGKPTATIGPAHAVVCQKCAKEP